MLDGHNMKTRRPSCKLDHKLHGPFQVEKVISPIAICLTLPQRWKIHNVFHTSLIKLFRSGIRAPLDLKQFFEKQMTLREARSMISMK
jgi:hypothetical protein